MKRREFITLLGGAAAACAARRLRAQQPKLPRIGVLLTANPEPFWQRVPRTACASMATSRAKTLQFEFRSADGTATIFFARWLTSLFVSRSTSSSRRQTPAVIAARQATSEIPIVMAPAGDPVATGLVSSLARPGGNITGIVRYGRGARSKSASNCSAMCCRPRGVWPSWPMRPIHSARPFVEQIEQGGRSPGHCNPNDLGPRRGASSPRRSRPWSKQRADAVMVQGSLPAQTRSRSGG